MDQFFEQILSTEFGIKLIAFVACVQIALYGIGEVLTRVADFTDNKWDNDLAKKIAKASWILGVVVSKFGYSTPKLILQEKKKK